MIADILEFVFFFFFFNQTNGQKYGLPIISWYRINPLREQILVFKILDRFVGRGSTCQVKHCVLNALLEVDIRTTGLTETSHVSDK